MKRLIHRELIAVARKMQKEYEDKMTAAIEQEYQKMASDKLFKAMKKRAKLLDAYTSGGASDYHLEFFKNEMHVVAVEKVNMKAISYHTIYDALVIAQIDSQDLAQLITTVKKNLGI